MNMPPNAGITASAGTPEAHLTQKYTPGSVHLSRAQGMRSGKRMQSRSDSFFDNAEAMSRPST